MAKPQTIHLASDFDKTAQAVVALCTGQPVLKESGELWTSLPILATCEACKAKAAPKAADLPAPAAK